uniref:NADH-ubiquinone oxidoreductase chain 4L n=1 Tax=Paratkina nigrifasciana TaxID=3004265 RepID=A0A9E9JIH2_9HEMI|nr:NADH dehydrogenase subunit 4L [Paratkina nigrifasciana]WAP91641.1 NADH dehydrogenase subunit 4L [Paratkina nigrifasciana]
MNIYFFMYMFIFSLLSLILIRKHLLLCLLSLEFMVLSLMFLTILFFMFFYFSSLYIFVILMTFYVCEGVLGLSVLVSMIRFHGNNYLNSMFLW